MISWISKKIGLCKETGNDEKMIFTAAKTVLSVMMDEYTKERERSAIIDNKAIVLITIIIALLTIYVPIIPFDRIVSIYNESSREVLIFLTLAILLFIAAIIITIVAFIKLIKIVKMKSYQRVTIEDIANTEALQCAEDEAEKALCVHYKDLIIENAKINDQKADSIENCFSLTVILFLLLLVSTVILLML